MLKEIVDNKMREVEERKRKLSLKILRSKVSDLSSRSFKKSISSTAKINIIAEIKRFSPSAGIILRDFNPSALAKTYQENEASAIPSYCEKFGKWKVIKSFQVKDEGVLKEIPRYKVDAYLLDTHSIGKRGGTGRTFDWKIAKKVRRFGVPIILSGGLNPGNIVQAIIKVRPYAVDVSSGVEKERGVKDYQKLRDFIKKVRVQNRISLK